MTTNDIFNMIGLIILSKKIILKIKALLAENYEKRNVNGQKQVL